MREIALDTETTGLSTKEGDRIIEIGCVEIVDKRLTGKDYHVYIDPQRELSVASTEITGLTSEFLQGFKTFDKIAQSFLDFIGNDRLVIHNAKFDMGFLNYELELMGGSSLVNDVVDTLDMAKRKYPGSPATLDALCRRFKIDSTKRTKHGALIDAELLALVYIHMSVALNQMDIFSIKAEIKENVIISYNNKSPVAKRDFPINEEDFQNHKQFLRKIKNTLWIQ